MCASEKGPGLSCVSAAVISRRGGKGKERNARDQDTILPLDIPSLFRTIAEGQSSPAFPERLPHSPIHNFQPFMKLP